MERMRAMTSSMVVAAGAGRGTAESMARGYAAMGPEDMQRPAVLGHRQTLGLASSTPLRGPATPERFREPGRELDPLRWSAPGQGAVRSAARPGQLCRLGGLACWRTGVWKHAYRPRRGLDAGKLGGTEVASLIGGSALADNSPAGASRNVRMRTGSDLESVKPGGQNR
jgi:hypothetical protein